MGKYIDIDTDSELVFFFTSLKDKDDSHFIARLREIPDDKHEWITQVNEEWEKVQEYLQGIYGERFPRG
ncbi:MAG: hypothetical protein GY861_10790 [bacterium]|nr:hypothetical protein [bacterium]